MNTARRGRIVIVRFVVCLAAASFGMAASATVVGDLKTGSAGTMILTLGSISFGSDPSSAPPGPPWNAEVANGTALTFTGGPLAITEGISVFGPLTFGTTPLPVNTYLQFAAHPNLVYSLTAFGPGSPNTNCATAATVGASCSIFAGSPFLLTKSADGTAITFTVFGKASDTGVAGLALGSNYEGAFVGPVANQSPVQIQLFFCPSGTCMAADFSSGKSLTSSQAADFVASGPTDTPTGTPTSTPTDTPTVTPTETPTTTPTVTPTNTRVPQGGACTDTAQCVTGLRCVNGVCVAVNAPTPPVSRLGLLIGLGALITIAAASLRRFAGRAD